MCKVMVLTGVPKDKSAELLKFVKAARPELTKSERDGFGYVAFNETSGMFGERWVKVADAFKRRQPLTAEDRVLISELGGSIEFPEVYSAFGNVNEDLEGVTTIALHARTSTNSISLKNTHPFFYDGYALIHNGVIANQRELINKTSTCDSECILHEYNRNNVAQDIRGIQSVADVLYGYYVCAVMGFNGEMWHLDVFKDNRASLYFATIPEFGNAKIWCTCPIVLRATLSRMKFKTPTKIFDVKADCIARFDVVTGKCVETMEFESVGWGNTVSAKSWDNWKTDEPPVYREDAAIPDEDDILENEDVVEAMERTARLAKA